MKQRRKGKGPRPQTPLGGPHTTAVKVPAERVGPTRAADPRFPPDSPHLWVSLLALWPRFPTFVNYPHVTPTHSPLKNKSSLPT